MRPVDHQRHRVAIVFLRRGTLASTKDADGVHHLDDVLHMSLAALGIDYEWGYTHDHAKWGISETDDWVVIADINRDPSQEKRGGGGVAFQHPLIWKFLSEAQVLK